MPMTGTTIESPRELCPRILEAIEATCEFDTYFGMSCYWVVLCASRLNTHFKSIVVGL